MRKVMASPLLPQPKQWKKPFSALTEKLGDFSPWNGHRPTQLLPTRFRARCWVTSPTRSVASRTRTTSSSTMPMAGQSAVSARDHTTATARMAAITASERPVGMSQKCETSIFRPTKSSTTATPSSRCDSRARAPSRQK